jgi:N-acetylglutamate synthase-like GNAT family acetyltransferase
MNHHIEIRRASRGDLGPIVALVANTTQSKVQVDETEVMEWLFTKGLWVACHGGTLLGVIAWQAENLVSVTDVFYVSPKSLYTGAATQLIETIETEAKTLMCEANVVILPDGISQLLRDFLHQQGYEPRPLTGLHRIWQEVLGEFADSESQLMVKTLRDRMVLHPL